MLTASIPICSVSFDFASEATFHVGKRVTVGGEDFPQKSYVGNGQAKSVYFTEPFLVGKSGHVHAKFVECGVYTAAHHNYS